MVALTCLLTCVHSAPAAAVEGTPSLAPGWWVGAYLTSTTSKDRGPIVIGISRSGAATGSVDATGLAAAVAQRRASRLALSGRLRVSGTPTDLLAEGKIRARGRVKVMGFSVPVDRKVPAVATLHLLSATCSLASGDLSGSAQLPSQLADHDTSVAAKLVLRRVERKPTPAQIRSASRVLVDEFLDAGATVRKAERGAINLRELRSAFVAMETLFARTAVPECRPSADTELHQAFTLAVLKLVNHAKLNGPELAEALRLSAELGLLSDNSAGRTAAALRSSFKQALIAGLERADDDAKARLRVAATQYGFGGVL